MALPTSTRPPRSLAEAQILLRTHSGPLPAAVLKSGDLVAAVLQAGPDAWKAVVFRPDCPEPTRRQVIRFAVAALQSSRDVSTPNPIATFLMDVVRQGLLEPALQSDLSNLMGIGGLEGTQSNEAARVLLASPLIDAETLAVMALATPERLREALTHPSATIGAARAVARRIQAHQRIALRELVSLPFVLDDAGCWLVLRHDRLRAALPVALTQAAQAGHVCAFNALLDSAPLRALELVLSDPGLAASMPLETLTRMLSHRSSDIRTAAIAVTALVPAASGPPGRQA